MYGVSRIEPVKDDLASRESAAACESEYLAYLLGRQAGE
jgi:hypothetical protein